MHTWLATLRDNLSLGTPTIRIVVASTIGSTPRDVGATMLLWQSQEGDVCSHGSIGGGHLEARAMEIATDLLKPHGQQNVFRRTEKFSLGASLGQCCGGIVQLYWELFSSSSQVEQFLLQEDAQDLVRYCSIEQTQETFILNAEQIQDQDWPILKDSHQAGLVQRQEFTYFAERLIQDVTPIWIYGAGHVSQAITQKLQDLPFQITWVDNRPDILQDALSRRQNLAVNVLLSDNPADEALDAPDHAWHLVMTHSHDLDFEICEALLKKNKFGFLGLLGSRSKEIRFRQRLMQKSYAPELVDRLVCPIGLKMIHSKQPAAIAIAVAADLLQMRERIIENAFLEKTSLEIFNL